MVQGKEETEGRHGGLGLLGALHEHEHDRLGEGTDLGAGGL